MIIKTEVKEESMKKKKTKKFLIRRLVAVILIVFLIFVVKNWIYQASIKRQTKQICLFFNYDMIQLISNIYVEDSVIYISKEDIKNIFDDTIYYNMGDKELITTYNKHVAVLHLDDTKMLINDAEFEMQGKLKQIDSEIYLPLSDLEIVYDMETEYVPETNRVIMNSIAKSKKQVIALKDSKITLNKNPFSVTIEKVKRGDNLVAIEESGSYKKVQTSNGNIGYIKTKKVSEEEILREDWIEEKIEMSSFENMDELFIVTKEQVNISNISTAFTTYSMRNDMIKNLYDQVMQNQYKGVCIDFEEIDDVNSFYRFLIELSPKFKESGLKVVVKVKQQLDKEKVKNMVDFTIE